MCQTCWREPGKSPLPSWAATPVAVHGFPRSRHPDGRLRMRRREKMRRAGRGFPALIFAGQDSLQVPGEKASEDDEDDKAHEPAVHAIELELRLTCKGSVLRGSA